MNRGNNFKRDNELYGKFGERIFAEYGKSNNWNIADVSNDERSRDLDIDFIRIISPDCTVDKFFEERVWKNKSEKRMKTVAMSFEVKTDLVTKKYGNVVYEILSYDNPGCLARSVADFIFYIQTDEKGANVERIWIINLRKWRTWLREHDKVINTEGSPIRLNNFDPKDSRCFNFLCKIEKMVEDGVAREIDWKKFWTNGAD